MASFSLEYDGLFIPDTQSDYSDDPFESSRDLSYSPNKDKPLMECKYSDISDDEDFDIPCSQKRPSER